MRVTTLLMLLLCLTPLWAQHKQLAYLVSDIRIPFWSIMNQGISDTAQSLDFNVSTYSAHNSLKRELENTMTAIRGGAQALILSPVSSSSAVTVMKLAKRYKVPVIIADIGADDKGYLSYIASNNFEGAYRLGQLLVREFKARKSVDATVGIVAIPQNRDNGKARTAGFMKALNEGGISSSGLRQQKSFSCEETYDFVADLIASDPKLGAIWLQGSDRYRAALQAIEESGKRDQILLVCFDAEPEFLELIANKTILSAAMQQPYLIGSESVRTLKRYFDKKPFQTHQKIDTLTISHENIDAHLKQIRRNVLGLK